MACKLLSAGAKSVKYQISYGFKVERGIIRLFSFRLYFPCVGIESKISTARRTIAPDGNIGWRNMLVRGDFSSGIGLTDSKLCHTPPILELKGGSNLKHWIPSSVSIAAFEKPVAITTPGNDPEYE